MTAITITRASVTGLPICEEGIEIAKAVLPGRRRMTLAQTRLSFRRCRRRSLSPALAAICIRRIFQVGKLFPPEFFALPKDTDG